MKSALRRLFKVLTAVAFSTIGIAGVSESTMKNQRQKKVIYKSFEADSNVTLDDDFLGFFSFPSDTIAARAKVLSERLTKATASEKIVRIYEQSHSVLTTPDDYIEVLSIPNKKDEIVLRNAASLFLKTALTNFLELGPTLNQLKQLDQVHSDLEITRQIINAGMKHDMSAPDFLKFVSLYRHQSNRKYRIAMTKIIKKNVAKFKELHPDIDDILALQRKLLRMQEDVHLTIAALIAIKSVFINSYAPGSAEYISLMAPHCDPHPEYTRQIEELRARG
jgi:hypothetical protein